MFELLFELKSGLNPDFSNLSSLFIRLNELNTKALPNYFCALVLFSILNNQREDFNVFLNSGGDLESIANMVIDCVNGRSFSVRSASIISLKKKFKDIRINYF